MQHPLFPQLGAPPSNASLGWGAVEVFVAAYTQQRAASEAFGFDRLQQLGLQPQSLKALVVGCAVTQTLFQSDM